MQPRKLSRREFLIASDQGLRSPCWPVARHQPPPGGAPASTEGGQTAAQAKTTIEFLAWGDLGQESGIYVVDLLDVHVIRLELFQAGFKRRMHVPAQVVAGGNRAIIPLSAHFRGQHHLLTQGARQHGLARAINPVCVDSAILSAPPP